EVLIVDLGSRVIAREDALAVDRHGHAVATPEQEQVPAGLFDVEHPRGIREGIRARVECGRDVETSVVRRGEPPARGPAPRPDGVVEARGGWLVDGRERVI